LNGGEPIINQRPVAVALASDLRRAQALPVVEVEHLDGRSFPQAVVGVEGTEKLKDPGREAGLTLDGKGYANDWLTEEFRARAGKKRKLILVDRLSAALKLVDIKVTPAEVTSESNVLKLRRRLAVPQLSRSGFSSEQQIITYRDEWPQEEPPEWPPQQDEPPEQEEPH
jgi:hypothetical protein